MRRGLLYAFAIAWSLLAALPILWMFYSSAKSLPELNSNRWLPPAQPRFENFIEVLTGAEGDGANQLPILQNLLNSVIISGLVVFITIMLASLAAYGMARQRRAGKWLLPVVLFGFIMPSQALIMPIWFIERQAGLVDTYPGIILPIAALSMPFAILLFRAYFQDFEADIEDAARIDGCSRFGTFWRVVLPMARGPIAAVAVLLLIGAWNEFLLVLVLAESDSMRTLTVGIWGFVGIYRTPYHIILAGLVISTIPILIAYLLFQRQITESFSLGTTGGR